MTKKTKRTPGPWKAAKWDDGSMHIESEDGFILADNNGGNEDEGPRIEGFIPTMERDANAYLMAAAPELLEAAKRVLQVLRNMAPSFRDDLKLPTVGHTEWGKQLEAAISKAEGRS